LSTGSRHKILWTPWRMSYVARVGEKKECIFCEAIKNPDQYYVVRETEYSIALLNAYPYNTGHVMIAPKKHAPDLELLSDNELIDLMKLMRLILQALKIEYSPHGFNIGINIGRAAGAGVEDHVHIHIVPRWIGDTNFLPIVSNTKTIPEDLNTTRRRISEAIKKIEGSL